MLRPLPMSTPIFAVFADNDRKERRDPLARLLAVSVFNYRCPKHLLNTQCLTPILSWRHLKASVR